MTRWSSPARPASQLRHGLWRSRVWVKATSEIGLPGLHFHDLRHAGNMLAAETGATLRDLMGHSTTRAALIYLHGSDARQREIAGALSRHAEQHIADPSRAPTAAATAPKILLATLMLDVRKQIRPPNLEPSDRHNRMRGRICDLRWCLRYGSQKVIAGGRPGSALARRQVQDAGLVVQAAVTACSVPAAAWPMCGRTPQDHPRQRRARLPDPDR